MPTQNSFIQRWIDSCVPSPSPHDNVILYDQYSEAVRKIQVGADKEENERETIQKKFYVKCNEIIYENWKIQHHDLIYKYYLQHGKPISLIGTI